MKRIFALMLALCMLLPFCAFAAVQTTELSANGITVLRNHEETQTEGTVIAVDYPTFVCDDAQLQAYLTQTLETPFRALLSEEGYSRVRSGFNVNMDYPGLLSLEGTVTMISKDSEEKTDHFFWRLIDLNHSRQLEVADLFAEDAEQVTKTMQETIFQFIDGQQIEEITSADQVPLGDSCYLKKDGLVLFYSGGTLHEKSVSLTIPFSLLPLTPSVLLGGEEIAPEASEEPSEPEQETLSEIYPSDAPAMEPAPTEPPAEELTPQPAPKLDPNFTLAPVITPTPLPLEATDAEIQQVLCRGLWKQLGTDGSVYYQFLPDGKLLTISVSEYSLSNGQLDGQLNGTVDVGSESAFTLWNEEKNPSGYVLNRQGEAVAPEEFVTPIPTPSPTPTPTPSPEPTPSPTPSSTPTPDPTPTPTPTLSPYQVAEKTLPTLSTDENAAFEKRQTKQVYTAPSTEAYRADGAQVDTNEEAQIYGINEEGWVMLGYTIGNKNAKGRIGYIKDSSLLSPDTVQKLKFAAMPFTLEKKCKATDDPLFGQQTMLTLEADSQITLLAFLGEDWVYVETVYEEKLCRVFIPRKAIMEE